MPRGRTADPAEDESMAGESEPVDGDAEAEAAFNATEDADVGDAAGQSIEDLAEQEPAEPPMQGDYQLSLLVGGREPESSSIHLRGGALPLEGQFEKGDRVRIVVECVVAEVHFIDRLDDHGNVIGSERKHVARRAWVRRSPDSPESA